MAKKIGMTLAGVNVIPVVFIITFIMIFLIICTTLMIRNIKEASRDKSGKILKFLHE